MVVGANAHICPLSTSIDRRWRVDVGIDPYKKTVHFVGGGAFDAPLCATVDEVSGHPGPRSPALPVADTAGDKCVQRSVGNAGARAKAHTGHRKRTGVPTGDCGLPRTFGACNDRGR